MNVYLNRLKCILRNKATVFWTLIFPIIMALLFKMAFGDVFTTSDFKTINVGVINSSSVNTDLITYLESETFGEKKAFKITYYDEESEDILSKEEGYLRFGTEIDLVIKESGINQNIIKSYVDGYLQTTDLVYNVISITGNIGVLDELSNYDRYVLNRTKDVDLIMNYFYTLIAMSVMFGCTFSLEDLHASEANMSDVGKRVNIAPTHKLKLLVSNLCASFTIIFSEILIYLLFLRFILNVDFGSNALIILGVVIIGCLNSLLFGLFVGVLIKGSEAFKNGIVTGIVLFMCFLSGMMMATIKFTIYENAKFLHYLNPCSLITDSLYMIYIDQIDERFVGNIIALGGLSVIFLVVSYIKLRGRRYESV